MSLIAWDAFTSAGSMGGRAAEDGAHVWTLRPTLPVVGALATPTYEAPVPSTMITTVARAYSNMGVSKSPVATMNVGVADVDVQVDVESLDDSGMGAGLILRWTSNTYVGVTLYHSISGGGWAFLARRYTVSPFSVVSLGDVTLGAGVNGWPAYYSKLRAVAVGSSWSFYAMPGKLVSEIPATPVPGANSWVLLSTATDGIAQSSTDHGVHHYFAGPYTGGSPYAGFGLDNFAVYTPADVGGWAVGLIS